MSDDPTPSAASQPKPDLSDTARETPSRRGRPPSDRILDRLTKAALTILETDDISALTIEHVCKVAKVSRATFYRRWTSINPVFTSTVAHILQESSPPIIDGSDLRADIRRGMLNRSELLADKRVGGLFRHAFSAAGTDDELRHLIQELDRERNAPLIALLEQAQAEGRVRRDIHPEYVAYQLFGPIWHRSLLLQLPSDPDFISAVLDSVLNDILLDTD
tara:strand:+ start:604 stop:1260 length:657 start_codon:yes stop_codon:yes gene_type:complete